MTPVSEPIIKSLEEVTLEDGLGQLIRAFQAPQGVATGPVSP